MTEPNAVLDNPTGVPNELITVDTYRVGHHRPNHVYLERPDTTDPGLDEEVAVALVPGYGPVIACALNYYAQAIASGAVPVAVPEHEGESETE